MLLGANIVAAQSALPQGCDPYGIGTSLVDIQLSNLTAPVTGNNALASQSIGINPQVFIMLANNVTEIDHPQASNANPQSHLAVASAAVVTSDGDQLKVYAGICDETTVLGELWAGTRVTVLDGPFASDGLAWWRVRRNELTGWVIEGENNQLWLQGLSS